MPRLLVVDDEQDVLDFVERVFRREYQVASAHSVEEALALLDGGVDVIITDHRMPRRSGFELLERARVLSPSSVRVLLTGYSDHAEGTAASGGEDGADVRLIKPIDADALRQAVADAVARKACASPRA